MDFQYCSYSGCDDAQLLSLLVLNLFLIVDFCCFVFTCLLTRLGNK